MPILKHTTYRTTKIEKRTTPKSDFYESDTTLTQRDSFSTLKRSDAEDLSFPAAIVSNNIPVIQNTSNDFEPLRPKTRMNCRSGTKTSHAMMMPIPAEANNTRQDSMKNDLVKSKSVGSIESLNSNSTGTETPDLFRPPTSQSALSWGTTVRGYSRASKVVTVMSKPPTPSLFSRPESIVANKNEENDEELESESSTESIVSIDRDKLLILTIIKEFIYKINNEILNNDNKDESEVLKDSMKFKLVLLFM